jgi:hypothetical protein
MLLGGIVKMRTYIGLFVLALATLLVEVLLTRIFDVIMWPNIAFAIISCAMFGLGLGGLYEVVRAPAPARSTSASAARAALVFALSVWSLPLMLNVVPFSLSRVGYAPASQIAWFLVLYIVLLAPFFFAGLCICRLFSAHPDAIHRLYFWDLSGAALGTLALVPLLPRLGPERLLLVAAIGGLASSALLSDSFRWRLRLAAVAAAFLVAPIWLGGPYLTLALHDDKRDVQSAIAEGHLDFSRWDPVSQISIIDQPATTRAAADHGKKHVAYDGGTQSSNFFPFDGDFAKLRQELPRRLLYQFWQRGVLASHYLRRDRGSRVLVIGSAGGQETKAAVLYGASRVDAVEMVGTVVELATHQYADYIGHLFEQPGVHPHVGEGRSFLRASNDTYDIIQIFSNYTSSSVAQGSGAISPVYLQTVEAYREYYSHLSRDGILHISRYAYPRMIATAAAAWRLMGRDDFRAHVVVFEKRDATNDHNPTVLIKMSPWTRSEIEDLTSFFSFVVDREPPYQFAENPFDPAHSFLPDVFYSGNLPPALLRSASYDVSVATDDRPYFNFLRRSLRHIVPDQAHGVDVTTAAILNSEISGGWLPMDWLHLILTVIAAAVYGALFVLVPMRCSPVGREAWTGKGPVLLYFSLLGFAFMAMELLFIQIFMKLIGYPLYTVATVITVMLVAAALGSMSSRVVVGPHRRRWYAPFVAVVTTGLVLWLSYPTLSSYFIAATDPVRILAATVMIAPIAFFMGMPFPLGIAAIEHKPRGAVAWAWSMNGFFTAVGGVATALLSLWLGFRITLLMTLAAYAAAAAAYAALRRTTSERVPDFERSGDMRRAAAERNSPWRPLEPIVTSAQRRG